MSKHTPGPWSDKKIWPTPDHLIHANIDGQPFALACAYGMRGQGEREANAKLIAAAPEMLEALRDVAENTVSLEMRAKVYAAINKATA